MPILWEVIGGADTGGVLVREGLEVSTPKCEERLSTGAVIEELNVKGDRLHYRLVSGSGPTQGGISTRLANGKELARRLPQDKSTLSTSNAPSADAALTSEAPVVNDGQPVAVETPQISSQEDLAKEDAGPEAELANQQDTPSKAHRGVPPPLSGELKQLFGTLGEDTPIEEIKIPKNVTLRVCTISDVHVDYGVNRKWLETRLPKKDKRMFNVLILPGDVSDDLDKLKETLQMFKKGFDMVCYTVGNHDLWVARQGSPPDSLIKLRQVLAVCKEARVKTGPVRFCCYHGSDVYVVPLHSFYCHDWDMEPDPPWQPDSDMSAWVDFNAIRWPQELQDEVSRRGESFAFGSQGTSPAISEIFAALNEPVLRRLLSKREKAEKPVVISYSHYLPRQELFPEKRFLIDASLHKVSGSRALESQVRRLAPDVHIFGHTHLTVDYVLEGQRYLQWALGSPGEQQAMTRAVKDTGMLVLYDAGGDEPHIAPVQTTFWGNFFRRSGRSPTETCPAPFVRSIFAKKHKDVELPFDDEYYLTTPNPGPAIMNYEGLYEQRWRQ